MKKISLLILLATFSFADKIHCLYVTSTFPSQFCTTKIEYDTSTRDYYIYMNKSSKFTLKTLQNVTITTGYSIDTITNTYELDPQYEQFDVTHLITQPEILIDYINNPPLPITEPEPTDPDPTDPDPTPTQPEPDKNEPEPIPTNPTNIYKYGLTYNDFNFLSGATGLICAFLISSSIIRKF